MVHTEKHNVKLKAYNLERQQHHLPEIYAREQQDYAGSGGDEMIPTLPSLDKSLLMQSGKYATGA